MSTTVRSPLSDFRAVNAPAAGIAPTATTTAPALGTMPPGNNNPITLVVQDVTASLYAGTAIQSPVQAFLVDGTAGGTNVAWQSVLAGAANGFFSVGLSNLNIPCKSGFATMYFGTGLGTTAQASVAFGGFYQGGYNY